MTPDVDAARAALTRRPAGAADHLARARALASLGLLRRAADELDASAAADPSSDAALRLRAGVLDALGDRVEAAATLARLGERLAAWGAAAEARGAYAAAAARDPGFPGYRVRAAGRPAGWLVKAAVAAAVVASVAAVWVGLERRSGVAEGTALCHHVGHATVNRDWTRARALVAAAAAGPADDELLAALSERVDALAGADGRVALERARALDDAGRVREAARAYGDLVRRFEGLGPARAAAERLEALEARLERSEALVRRVGALLAEGREAEAFAAGREVLERWPDSPAVDRLEVPIRVETAPVSAIADLEGQRRGQTPFTVVVSAPQAMTLILRRTGFVARRVELEPKAPGLTYPLRVVLDRERSWRHPTLGPLTVPLAAAGGRAFVAGSDGRVRALAGNREAWQASLGPFAEPSGPPVPGPDGGCVVADDLGRVVAFDGRGAAAWAAEPGAGWQPVAWAGPVVVLAGPEGALVGLDGGSGEPRWTGELPAAPLGPPAVVGPAGARRVVFALGTGDVVAVAAAEGSASRLPLRGGGRATAPAVAGPGRRLLVRTSDGLEVLGDRGGTASLPGESRLAPAASAGAGLVVAAAGTRLAAFALDGLEAAWTVEMPAPPLGLAAGSGEVYATTADEVLAWRAADGELAWRHPAGAGEARPVAGVALWVRDGFDAVGHLSGP